MNEIIKNIKDTPSQLLELLDNSNELFKSVVSRDIKQIMITGSGTSYHSGEQMQQIMREKSGIAVEAFYPFKLTNQVFDTEADHSHTLFVGISQEGASLTTYNAMKLAKKYGCIVATMSGNKNAYINKIADEILTVDIGIETAGPKTKGYYATKLNLLLLSEYIGLNNQTISAQDFESDLMGLGQTLNQFPHAVSRAIGWVERNKQEFAIAHDMRISAPASLYGDVLESTLKILESCRLPITGYEFNEFIHGVYNAINSQSTLFFMDDGTEPKINKMIELLSQWTNNIYLIQLSDIIDKNHFGYDVKVSRQFETFIYPIVFQVMTALVPELHGVNPSIPKDPDFHQKMGSQGEL